MSFDRAHSVRRIRPQRKTGGSRRWTDADLQFANNAQAIGPELLLDTCVYIDVLQGRSPPEVDSLLRSRIKNHSTVALAELTHSFGRLDPDHPHTRRALAELSGAIDDIPAHRLSAPSKQAFGEAGMLTGVAIRLYGAGSGVALLNDALLFLQARESGCAILTANIADFGTMNQLLPGSDLLFYRALGSGAAPA